jgi:hypothetical protein
VHRRQCRVVEHDVGVRAAADLVRPGGERHRGARIETARHGQDGYGLVDDRLSRRAVGRCEHRALAQSDVGEERLRGPVLTVDEQPVGLL